jgi:hypothetical protein
MAADPREPSWAHWEPEDAARRFRGREITRAERRCATGVSTHRSDYQEPQLPPRDSSSRRSHPSEISSRPFRGSTTASSYRWPEAPVECEEQTPSEHTEYYCAPAAWPTISYHGACAPSDRAFRDAVIDEAEAEAWRWNGKTLPERSLFHGEDERKAVGRDPLTRAGSCDKHRAAQAQVKAPPTASRWTRNNTGSSYDWPQRMAPNSITWRQHACAPVRQRNALVAGGATAAATAPRTRATDYKTTSVGQLMGGPLGHPAEPPQRTRTRPRSAFALVSTAEWKSRQREKVRTAMPGGMRDAAAHGCRGALPAGIVGWRRPGRNGLTSMAGEPLDLGEKRANSLPPNQWHVIAARRHK